MLLSKYDPKKYSGVIISNWTIFQHEQKADTVRKRNDMPAPY